MSINDYYTKTELQQYLKLKSSAAVDLCIKQLNLKCEIKGNMHFFRKSEIHSLNLDEVHSMALTHGSAIKEFTTWVINQSIMHLDHENSTVLKKASELGLIKKQGNNYILNKILLGNSKDD